MKINLSDIPLIDNHAHPYPSDRLKDSDYVQRFNFSLNRQADECINSTLFFKMFCKKYAEFLGLPEDTSVDLLFAESNRLLRNDRKNYLKRLFDDVKLIGFITDMGSPVSKKLLTSVEVEEYDLDMVPYIDARINRIEWVCEDILESGIHTFEDFTDQFVNGILEVTHRNHHVGLKSIIAYKTGLHVNVLSEEEFRKGYYLYLSDPSNRAYEKIVRDYCLCKTCEVCAENNIPLQIHTGHGDGPMLDIRYANPALLYEVFNKFPKTRIMLIHSGYPYVEEFGLMMNQYENVWGDVSELLIFAGAAGETKLRDVLEMAPTKKLTYGSDGGSPVEFIWYAAKMFRQYFTDVLQNMVDKEFISYNTAMEMAKDIMYENAKRFYGI